jgi:hypothetical protein
VERTSSPRHDMVGWQWKWQWMPPTNEGKHEMEKFEMDAETEERRRRATARFMLRVIAAEQKHGIIRPDAVEFKARTERQANGDESR